MQAPEGTPKPTWRISTNELDRLINDELRPPVEFRSVIWFRWKDRSIPYQAYADPDYRHVKGVTGEGARYTYDYGVGEFIRTGGSLLATAGDLLSEVCRRGRIREGHYEILISP